MSSDKQRRRQSDGVLAVKTWNNVPGARRFVLRVRQKAKSNQSADAKDKKTTTKKKLAEEDKVVEVKRGATALPAGFNAPPRRDGNSRSYTSLNNKTCRLFTSPASISRIITGQSLSSLLLLSTSARTPAAGRSFSVLISGFQQAVAVIRYVKSLVGGRGATLTVSSQ